MAENTDGDGEEPKPWRASAVWARAEEFEGNPVKQLVAPAGEFDELTERDRQLWASNVYGSWPAAPASSPLSADQLWVRLPVARREGHAVSGASWSRPSAIPLASPGQVLDSYRAAITLIPQRDDVAGLRPPQLGAVHAVLGYWTTNQRKPATVVMPTGTGKTETMLALLVAARMPRLLVLVPSDALREQVAAKFETLGILQTLGIVAPHAHRPVLGRVLHAFTDRTTATAFSEACNVIVATPQVLDKTSPHARAALLNACSTLFIDEAHHVAAKTWSDVRTSFADKDVVQFTATPFREDGKHLLGRTIYAFPLKEAQAQGYFSKIDYTSVIDFTDVDAALATQSIAKLRADLAAGYDHVLMARVKGVERAKDVVKIYEGLASDLNPVAIDSRMAKSQQKTALAALEARTSRIIVCVNMLGEGFDLPALKVAAVHNPQKSLGVTLQFIGRFARTSSSDRYGDASIFVARTELDIDRRLRDLYAEDSDWNLILRNLSQAAVEEQQEVSEFEEGFSVTDEVDIRSLLPKMSTVVYRTPTKTWQPEDIVDFFGEGNLLTNPIAINKKQGVAWCVVERRGRVRWGDIRTIEEVAYELFVLYFDRKRKLLYINNSANDGVFQELADAVVGQGATRFTGAQVYRVMADVDRLVPTNVGVLDARDQFRRFSMHVGLDVTASFSDAEAGTKTQTNISGGGYRDGEHVSISASLKGRVWSHATARSLKEWCDWCDGVGDKLLDETIGIEHVINQFILPKQLDGRPDGVLIALEWPWQLHVQQAETVQLSYAGIRQEVVYTELVPDISSTTGPFKFEVTGDKWAVPYEARVDSKGHLRYRCAGSKEVTVVRGQAQTPLSHWLEENGLTLVLDGDRVIDGDLLYQPTITRDPFDRAHLSAVDWSNTDLRVESQTKDHLVDSIQYAAIAACKAESPAWDIIIDDDGTGEIADIVALRLDKDELVIRFVHCKYAHDGTVGTRVADLYEVCGQAQKSIRWRRSDLRPFFRTLFQRAQRKQQRTGVDPFEAGDARKLFELQDRATVLRRRVEMVIVQPGMSVADASEQQLDLLASTQAYLKTTINADLSVWCSP